VRQIGPPSAEPGQTVYLSALASQCALLEE
jgi:hypothetical protein